MSGCRRRCPRSGGDYVFQSRVFGGGIGFSIVMSGFVIWILQWVALSGWLLSYLGFASLFLGLGGTMGNPTLTSIGVWFTTPWGIIIVSILNALLAMLLLVSGFKNYVKFQYVMWYATLLVILVSCCTCFFSATPETFAQKLERLRGRLRRSAKLLRRPRSMRRRRPISISIRHSVCWPRCWWRRSPGLSAVGEPIAPSRTARSRVPARSRTRLIIILGSLIATGVLLAALGGGLRARDRHQLPVRRRGRLLGGIGAKASSTASFSGRTSWPWRLAGSPIIVVLISLGYILNAFQIVNNCYIGMTRVMVAMSLDRLLPEWVSRVSDRLHTPVNAHLAYFLASIPVILVYNLWGQLDGADPRRHLRLRLRVHRHRTGRRPDAVPREGALRRLAWRGLQGWEIFRWSRSSA